MRAFLCIFLPRPQISVYYWTQDRDKPPRSHSHERLRPPSSRHAALIVSAKAGVNTLPYLGNLMQALRDQLPCARVCQLGHQVAQLALEAPQLEPVEVLQIGS